MDSSRPLATLTDFQAKVGEQDERRNTSCLAKFSQCLGMPKKGFEEEILYLLRWMKGIIEQKGQDKTSRKAKSLSSKSDR